MKNTNYMAICISVLRILLLLVMLMLIVPHLTTLVKGVYEQIMHREHVPYGTPMKVEVPKNERTLGTLISRN